MNALVYIIRYGIAVALRLIQLLQVAYKYTTCKDMYVGVACEGWT